MVRVGDRLQKERIRKGLTLEEVARATKIRYSFLDLIEKGEYRELPSGAYVYGFVRNYAKYLGLPEEEILALFKREYDEEKFQKVLPEGLFKGKEFPLKRFKFAQAFKVVTLVFLVLLVYIFFQYKSAIFNPPLEVSKPQEREVINKEEVEVAGKTDSNATVFVNNETASLDKEGNFKKSINVFPGKTKITIKAVNKFNKTTVVERNIEVKP